MDTTIRSSTRLRDKRLAIAGPQTMKNTRQTRAQRKNQAQPSQPSTSKPNSRKRQKNHHETTESITSKVSAASKRDGKVRGRRGQLKFMTETPMDVLYEIFASLEPVDLLHISWASKSLNKIVMSKSARFLWERAFDYLYASHQAPPSCPLDLNFAQYTKLLFDKRCMQCNSPHGSHISWVHRLRVCGKCLEGDQFTVLKSPHHYWLVIPILRTFVHGRYQTYVLASEHNEMKAKMHPGRLDSDESKEYAKQKADWMVARRQDESKFAQWQRNLKRDRKNELEDIRVKRRDVIIANLSELGWKEELDHLNTNQLWTLPGVRIARPLTDKAWETLCPELIEHLEAVKELRVEREKRDRIARRCEIIEKQLVQWSRRQPQSRTMPKILDIALTEPFKSFILSDSAEMTFIMDQEEFARTLTSFTDDWNESRNQFLVSLLSQTSSKSNTKGKAKAESNAAVLNLATTFFMCPSCPEPISYPRILAHECQSQPGTASSRRDTDPVDLSIFSRGYFTRPWFCESQNLSFDREASDIARMIIQECGENPDEVTPERMDEMDCRLECTRCRVRWGMKWRMAVQHELEKHTEPSEDTPSSRKGKRITKQIPDDMKWRLITDPEDLAVVYAKEDDSLPGKSILECKRCRQTVFSDPHALEAHWSYCIHCFPDTEPTGRTILSLTSTTSEKFTMPEEKELRAMFEVPLDQSIRSSHIMVKIPTQK